jgi:hypothetical protein
VTAFNQPVSAKSAKRILVVALALAAVVVGGRWAWMKYHSRNLTVAETRAAIRNYLEKQAGIAGFEPFRSATQTTNETNGSDAVDSPKAKKKKQKKAASSAAEELTRDFQLKLDEAADYRTIYRLVGENLAAVDQFLTHNDAEQTRLALLLAVEAIRASLEPAKNGWLAARISEAYIWPALDDVPAQGGGMLDAASLLDLSEEAFNAAGETENLIRNYRLLIARSEKRAKADKLRVHLAKILEESEKFEEAARVLHEVQDTNTTAFVRRRASVQTRLEQQRSR